MKTKKQIELIPIVAVATALIPLLAGGASAPAPENPDAIRPFHFKASKEALEDMRRRITATKWPGKETVPNSLQGVQLATMQALAKYWANEIYAAPRSWTEKAYPKLVHYNRLPKGTHFAAWEQPELFTQEVRAFKSLRQ